MTQKMLMVMVVLAAGAAQAQEVAVPCPPLVSFSRPPSQAAQLELSGQRNLVAGVLLMGIGGLVAVNGASAALYGFAHDEPVTMWAGTAVAAAGFGALVAGIPVYAVGQSQVKHARRLSIAPVAGAGGVQVNAAVRF